MRLDRFQNRFSAAIEERRGRAQPRMRLVSLAVPTFVALYIAAAAFSGSELRPLEQFDEGGAVDLLSALFLATSGGLAWACFSVHPERREWGRYFWLLISIGAFFLAVDELVEIHENLDYWIRDTAIGWPPFFRNWNDVIVLGYSLVALIAAGVFLPELLRYPRVAELALAAFGFGLVHSAIDMSVSNEVVAKDFYEESAKLIASSFLALSLLAALRAVARPESQGRTW